MLRIYVIGSIGKERETGRIELVGKELAADGHDVVTSLKSGVYSEKDWREDLPGAKEHFRQMKELIESGDFDIAVADVSAASDGRTNEEVILKQLGLRIIGISLVPVSSPWRLVWLDEIYCDLESLRSRIKAIEESNTLIDDQGYIHVPISGIIREILVTDLESVHAGQTLLVLESQGTPLEIASPVSGKVRVLAKKGERVSFGNIVMFMLEMTTAAD